MTTRTTTPARPITDRQVTFIESLAAQLDPSVAASLLIDSFAVVSIRDLSVQQASRFIDVIRPLSDAARAKVRSEERVVREAVAAVTGLTLGIYQNGDRVYRVYPNQKGTVLLAKLWDTTTHEWVYVGAAARFVTGEMRMTEAGAKEFGDTWGVCAWCGRTLSDPESLARGIGPVCARRVFS